jgi:hypothetical protein
MAGGRYGCALVGCCVVLVALGAVFVFWGVVFALVGRCDLGLLRGTTGVVEERETHGMCTVYVADVAR